MHRLVICFWRNDSARSVMREMVIKDHAWLASGATDVKQGRSRVPWRAASYAGFSCAVGLLSAGLVISGLSALGVIVSAKETGYAVVILLFASFTSAFLGAHSLDRLAESKTANEESDLEVGGKQ